MPPPKRPKAGSAWMNDLVTGGDNVTKDTRQDGERIASPTNQPSAPEDVKVARQDASETVAEHKTDTVHSPSKVETEVSPGNDKESCDSHDDVSSRQGRPASPLGFKEYVQQLVNLNNHQAANTPQQQQQDINGNIRLKVDAPRDPEITRGSNLENMLLSHNTPSQEPNQSPHVPESLMKKNQEYAQRINRFLSDGNDGQGSVPIHRLENAYNCQTAIPQNELKQTPSQSAKNDVNKPELASGILQNIIMSNPARNNYHPNSWMNHKDVHDNPHQGPGTDPRVVGYPMRPEPVTIGSQLRKMIQEEMENARQAPENVRPEADSSPAFRRHSYSQVELARYRANKPSTARPSSVCPTWLQASPRNSGSPPPEAGRPCVITPVTHSTDTHSHGNHMAGSFPGSHGNHLPGSHANFMSGGHAHLMSGNQLNHANLMSGSHGQFMPGIHGNHMPGSHGNHMPGSHGNQPDQISWLHPQQSDQPRSGERPSHGARPTSQPWQPRPPTIEEEQSAPLSLIKRPASPDRHESAERFPERDSSFRARAPGQATVCLVKGNSRPSTGYDQPPYPAQQHHPADAQPQPPQDRDCQPAAAAQLPNKPMTIASYVDSILTSVYMTENNHTGPTPPGQSHNAQPTPPGQSHNALHQDHTSHMLSSGESAVNLQKATVLPSREGPQGPPSEHHVNQPASSRYMDRQVLPPGDYNINCDKDGSQVAPPADKISPQMLDSLPRHPQDMRFAPQHMPDLANHQPHAPHDPRPHDHGPQRVTPPRVTPPSPYTGPPLVLSPGGSHGSQSPYHADSYHGDAEHVESNAPSMSSVCSNEEQTTLNDTEARTGSPGNQGADDKAVSRKCQICNDSASGFHYGVWSCEGCKAFFKRSLQGPNDYICPATNNCTIDKHRRKSCQACRLRKCTEMGMSRGTCREKKTYRQYHRQNMKRKSLGSPDCEVVRPKQPCLNSPDRQQNFIEPVRVKKEPQVCSVHPLVERPANHPAALPTDPAPIHPLVEHLMKIDPPVRFANSQISTAQSTVLETILKLTDTELIDIVAWAKGVPGYMDLPLTERMGLLEQSWMEILLLGLVWRSVPHHELLAFAPDLQLPQETLQKEDLAPVCRKLLALITSARALGLDREELVLLRACVLLNAGVSSVSPDSRFTELQTQVQESLHYTTVTRRHKPVTHVTRLLLLLPQLRQVSMEFTAYLANLRDQRKLPANCSLINEILTNQSINKDQSW